MEPDPDQMDVPGVHEPIVREHSEPVDGREPMPLWLIVFFGALLLWGGWYLAEYSGDWRGDVLDERAGRSSAPVRPGMVEDAGIDPLVLGRRVYTIHCMACHQIDGRGLPEQYPPLAGSDWVAGSPRRLARIVLHGLHGPIVVNGLPFDNEMPGHGDQLSDLRIAAVLTYIRQAWGNDYPPVDASLVAEIRALSAGRRTSWTGPELEELDRLEAIGETDREPPQPDPQALPEDAQPLEPADSVRLPEPANDHDE